LLLFSVVDFSVVVLVPEFGALLLVSVVVVDWDDFSDAAGVAGCGRRTFSALADPERQPVPGS
jgi:hypothetical protein